MKTYLINLDHSPERLSWFVCCNAMPGVEIVRVPAVDGSHLTDAERRELLKQRGSDYPMPPGALGCFLSHRAAWTRIVGCKDKWAFVVEDDAHLSSHSEVLFAGTNWIPDNADIVKAETSREMTEVSASAIPARNQYKLRRLKAAHRNTAGYFINRRTAERLLELTSQRCDPIDELLFNPELGVSTALTVYQLDPAISVQDKDAPMPMGFEQTIIRDQEPVPRVLMPFGPAKIARELTRVHRRKIRPKLLQWLQISQFKTIPFDGD